MSIEIILEEISKLKTREEIQSVQDALTAQAEIFKELIRDNFSIGDKVEFTDSSGMVHRGVVIKRMRTNIMVRVEGIFRGTRDIRVSPWLLRKIEETEK